MGAYMSEPVTDSCSDSGSNGIVTYGASSMQGWRTNQEDAHSAILDFDAESCLFAVYDGHGGAEVSDYTARKFPDFLKATELWAQGKIGEALETAFIQFDELLTKEEVIEELRQIAGIIKKDSQTDPDSADATHEEKQILFEEACLPIGEVLKKYGIIIGDATDTFGQSPTTNLKKKKRLQRIPEARVNSGENMDNDDLPTVADDKENLSATNDCGDVETVPSSTDHNNTGMKHKGKNSAETTDCPEPNPKDIASGMPEFKRARKDENCLPQTPPDTHVIPQPLTNGVVHNGDNQQAAVNGGKHLELIQTFVSECESIVMGRSPGKTPSAKSKEAEDANNQTVKESPVGERTHTKSESLNEEETVFKSETSSWTSLINLNEVGRRCNEVMDAKTKGGKSPKEKMEVEESAEEESSDDPEYNELEQDDSSDLAGNSDDDDEESGDEEESSGEDEEESEEMYPVPTGDHPGVDSGTTACVVVIKGKTLYVANAGDSRIVLCRKGEAVDLSVDHKPEDELEKDRIENAGGKITADGRVNGGLNLSRAIGDHFYKQNKTLPLASQMISALPDIRVEPLTSDDSFMVLACDGIWNCLTSQEVVDFVKVQLSNSVELSKICELLCERCLAPTTIGDGTGCDNMTAIVVDLSKLVGAN